MTRLRILMALAALLGLGCEPDPDLPEDPPLVVPGFTVTDPPPPTMPPEAPVIDGPALAVPGYDTIPPPPMPEMPPGAMPGGMPPGTPIPLASGFAPDPMLLRGMAGGQVNASQMAQGCAGFITSGPSYVLNVTAPFPRLRLVVSSQQDTTLVVRGPDQQFRCNDDGAAPDVNPLIDGPFAPGVHTIWVGTYQPTPTPVPYALGITTNPMVGPAQIAQAAGAAVPPGGAPPMQPNP